MASIHCHRISRCGILTLVAVLHHGLELLHLKSHLVQLVLCADHARGLGQHLLRAPAVLDDQVGGERGLVRGEAPDPEVVDLADARHPEEDVPHQVVAHTAGGRLHQDPEGVPQDGECGGEHEEAEDEGAYGVDDGVLGLEVDDQSSREYA